MRVSAIVPAYNAAATLPETLASLLSQSAPADEIIVVDDGSRDGTRAVVAGHGTRVRYVLQDNQGVSAARNRGVAEASGDWVAFCDADDIWHADKVAVLRAAIADTADVELVFHDFWTIVDGRVADPSATHSEDAMFPLFREFAITLRQILDERSTIAAPAAAFAAVDVFAGSAFRWLMLGNFLMPSTVAIRRATFRQSGGFDVRLRSGEDSEFFLRVAKSARFAWIDAPLSGYRRAAGTLLTGDVYLAMRNATESMLRLCVEDERVYRGPDRAWVRRAAARRLTRLAYYCLSELRPREARGFALQALRHDAGAARAWGIVAASAAPAGLLGTARRIRSALKR